MRLEERTKGSLFARVVLATKAACYGALAALTFAGTAEAGRIHEGEFLVQELGNNRAFVRSDVNGDGLLDISDPIAKLNYLFIGSVDLDCLDAADSNDDGTVDTSDPVTDLSFLFTGGLPPSAPFPAEGGDPTDDQLGCGELPPVPSPFADMEIVLLDSLTGQPLRNAYVEVGAGSAESSAGESLHLYTPVQRNMLVFANDDNPRSLVDDLVGEYFAYQRRLDLDGLQGKRVRITIRMTPYVPASNGELAHHSDVLSAFRAEMRGSDLMLSKAEAVSRGELMLEEMYVHEEDGSLRRGATIDDLADYVTLFRIHTDPINGYQFSEHDIDHLLRAIAGESRAFSSLTETHNKTIYVRRTYTREPRAGEIGIAPSPGPGNTSSRDSAHSRIGSGLGFPPSSVIPFDEDLFRHEWAGVTALYTSSQDGSNTLGLNITDADVPRSRYELMMLSLPYQLVPCGMRPPLWNYFQSVENGGALKFD